MYSVDRNIHTLETFTRHLHVMDHSLDSHMCGPFTTKEYSPETHLHGALTANTAAGDGVVR